MTDFFYKPPNEPLNAIYKDSSIIVINKPSGLLTVPGKGPKLRDSLLSRVKSAFFGSLLVHRLDMDTSGVIVFARTRSAQINLSKQFEKRLVKKTYIARVYGNPKEARGTVNSPIIVDWPNRPCQKICHETGREAITTWKVIDNSGKNDALIILKPITGRSHQLRLHMKSIGHPILGDSLYAHSSALKASKRLSLHALSILINHPSNGSKIIFKTPCPF